MSTTEKVREIAMTKMLLTKFSSISYF